MAAYAYTNTSLWPRQARPQSAMPKAIVAGICVGIIAGISTTAVLTELQPAAPTQVVVQVRDSNEKPVAAAALIATPEIVASRPTSAKAAKELPTISPPQVAVTTDADERTASTDGRGGETTIDRGAAVALTTPMPAPRVIIPSASVPTATAPTASAATASAPPPATPLVETAEAAKPAAEPAVRTSEPTAKPAANPARVAQKKRKNPTSHSSRNQNPFFPFFGGNGLFFGHRG